MTRNRLLTGAAATARWLTAKPVRLNAFTMALAASVVLAARAGPANAGFALFDQTTDTIQVAGQTIIGTASTYEAQIMFTTEHRGNGFVWIETRIFAEAKVLGVGPPEVWGFNFLGFSPIFVGQATLDLDQWHHIAYVYDGTQERLYLDGLLLAARAESGDVGDSDGGFHTVGAMAGDGNSRASFVGFIDALRISDIARYSGASFSAPVGDFASDAGTLLLYHFNEAPGTTTISDLSGNGHTGTLGVGFTGATPPTFIPEPACGHFVGPDFDLDCDVDLDDFDTLQACASGPAVPHEPDCMNQDLDADGDVDQTDFAILQRCYSGEGNPSDPNCDCPSGQTKCNGTCTDRQFDTANCGTCANACAEGLACQNGSCAACPDGAAFCGGACIDVMWDSGNCGACGSVCPEQTACAWGTCEGICIGCE